MKKIIKKVIKFIVITLFVSMICILGGVYVATLCGFPQAGLSLSLFGAILFCIALGVCD